MREAACLTERRKLTREHSTAGKRKVAQRQSGTTEPQGQVDMRLKLDLLNASFKPLFLPRWRKVPVTSSAGTFAV